MMWEHRNTDRTGADTWIGVTMGRTLLIRDNGPGDVELSDLYAQIPLGVFDTVAEAKAAGMAVTA